MVMQRKLRRGNGGPSGAAWLLGCAAAGTVAITARRRGYLTGGGAVAAAGVGGTVYAAGPPAASAAMLWFFGSSSLLTRLPGRVSERDAGGRNALQVLANGGAAALGAVMHSRTGSTSSLAFIGGSLAAATADTWATELGSRYGGQPRLITTGRRTEPGTDGAVSAVGLLAGAAGALTASAVYAVLLPAALRRGVLVRCLAGGLGGMLLDSLLGATLEGPDRPLGNDEVNLFCALSGGSLAASAGIHRSRREACG